MSGCGCVRICPNLSSRGHRLKSRRSLDRLRKRGSATNVDCRHDASLVEIDVASVSREGRAGSVCANPRRSGGDPSPHQLRWPAKEWQRQEWYALKAQQKAERVALFENGRKAYDGFEDRGENPVMAEALTQEVGLLRTIVRNLERSPIPVDPRVLAFWRAQGLEVPPGDPSSKTTIRPAGHDAFNQLSECLVTHSPAMERGANFANLQNELFTQLEAYVGCVPVAIGDADARRLVDHFDEWFKRLARPRRVFVPCVLTPWAAPRFNIGPVTFVYLDEITKGEFYPGETPPDVLAKYNFDTLLQLMRETHAHWLARVEVEGCEQQRAEEIGELAVDLAIVTLQLAAPNLDTRSMSRLDSRRGSADKRVFSEANGYYNGSWTRKEPGLAIGTGTLADILQKTKPLITAVGNVVRSFSIGVYRLPNLERAWCDGAYWLHEALAEPIDSIAIAKLETALEVLLRAESARGSTARVLAILQCFFGLQPDDPVAPGSTLTAKQFAANLVRDRSRILHGTWSTLNARLDRSRTGMEGFVTTVIRRAVIELETYSHEPAPVDDIDAFIAWLKQRPSLPPPSQDNEPAGG